MPHSIPEPQPSYAHTKTLPDGTPAPESDWEPLFTRGMTVPVMISRSSPDRMLR